MSPLPLGEFAGSEHGETRPGLTGECAGEVKGCRAWVRGEVGHLGGHKEAAASELGRAGGRTHTKRRGGHFT